MHVNMFVWLESHLVELLIVGLTHADNAINSRIIPPCKCFNLTELDYSLWACSTILPAQLWLGSLVDCKRETYQQLWALPNEQVCTEQM